MPLNSIRLDPRKALRRLRQPLLRTLWGVPRFEVEWLSSYADFQDYLARTKDLDEDRAKEELALIPPDARNGFRVTGFCGACRKWTRFHVDFGFSPDSEGRPPVPNWRESLVCPNCWLSCRMRACIQLFRDQLNPAPGSAIYMTEQVTGLFAQVKSLYPEAVGSEFLSDGTPAGSENASGVRHEDLTRLSFDDDRFDFLLTFEVLEHVPDYASALRECARVLKPGGTMLVTVPFHGKPSTTVRARVGPGGIEHLLPPEYHGDPVSSDGCLCFYHFGGDFLDALKDAGFREASICLTYSRPLGLFLRGQPMFIARK